MISVALCTYNAEKFIGAQIESILNQIQPVDEIVVCDDMSEDATFQILQNIAKNNHKVKIFRNKKNLGTIKNFEKAIGLTNGDIIFLADQDDIWYADKVQLMMQFFNAHPTCLLLFTNADLIDEQGNLLGKTLWDEWNFNDEYQKKWENNKFAMNDLVNNINKVTGATVAFKSSIKSEVLPICTPKGFWHDAWLAMHAAYYNGLCFLNASTLQYRLHSNQQVGVSTIGIKPDKFWVNSKVYERYVKKKFPEFSAALIPLPQRTSLLNRFIKKSVKFFIDG